MSQLKEIERVVKNHTESYEEAGMLLFDILLALNWDIEGVGNSKDAAMYLKQQDGVK